MALQMIKSLMARKLSVLGTPEWRTKPWQGQQKPIDVRMYDHGFALAKICEDLERCLGWPETKMKFDFITDCLHRLFTVDSCLEKLFLEMHAELPTPLYWADLRDSSSREGTREELVKGANFEFQSLHVAHICAVRWTIQLLVAASISLLYQRLNQMDFDAHGALGPAFPPNPRYLKGSEHRIELVGNIVRTMPYMMQPSMGTLGPTRCIFPMSVISNALKRSPIERARFPEVDFFNEQLAVRRGIGLASAVRDNEKYIKHDQRSNVTIF